MKHRTVKYGEHDIIVEYQHKQCDAYYKALEKGDGFASHYLHITPSLRSWESIQSEIRLIDLKNRYDAEMERIEKMPLGFIKFEI